MPKMKTKKAAKARFKRTKTGKLLHNSPNRRHILTKKKSKRKRQLKRKKTVHKGQLGMFKRIMGEC